MKARIEKGQRVIHENGTHGVAGIRDPRHNGVVRYMPDVLYLPDGAPNDTGWIWVPEAYLRPENMRTCPRCGSSDLNQIRGGGDLQCMLCLHVFQRTRPEAA